MENTIPKVSIIGAGTVGATLAMRVAESNLADVVLLDIVKDMSCAKALDILDAAPIVGHERSVRGTGDYQDIRSSDIIVITAGLARKPGMTREDLSLKNAGIVKTVSENIKRYSPSSIVIVVTNPLDAMTYLAYKITGFDRKKIFGMAGVLDGSRFAQLVSAELGVPRSSIKTYILGSHGDTMVPVLSKTLVLGKPIMDLIPSARLSEIVLRTRNRGAEIVSLLGTGSAYFSPSAAVFKMVEAIIKDKGEDLVVSACLEGEYGLTDIAIGVPCRIGRKGIDKIIELDLTEEEKAALLKSSQAIKNSIKPL